MNPVRKTFIVVIGAAAIASAGCTATYISRDEKSATVFRASIGTDSAVGDLSLADGKGASLQVKRHTLGQTEGLSTAADVAKAAASPLPISITK